jgi:DNA-binding transcriptional regulator YiaG
MRLSEYSDDELTALLPQTMSPAEFRCLREYLGLSTQWVAVQLGVGPRAVLRWESPGGTVPQRAASLLTLMRQRAHEAVDAYQVVTGGQHLLVPAEITGWADEMPPAWHRHIAVRAAEKLGANVLSIDYASEVK